MNRVTGRKRTACWLTDLAVDGLVGCDESGNADFAQPPAREAGSGVGLVERDVEAPQVSWKNDMGPWDGRPSPGGVWVAHPEAADPERAIVRNTANGNVVTGALFGRQSDLPGPAFQVSSDAAAAPGMLVGAPAPPNVTAPRREPAPPAREAPAAEERIAAPRTIKGIGPANAYSVTD
jgi:hypothetical protein